ncbi:MAG: fibronectin type III domain-containing protein, partial [Muribaculaceae bacterium]|nr:fibronectin type III domain-containing protein [Muribaculaceae bacterium]
MKFTKIASMFAVAIMMATAACSDDNDLTPLGESKVTVENATYNSLTFEWERVANARQYSCQLKETVSGNIIATDVTSGNTATFTGLTHATQYTLEVLSYAAIGSDYTTSEPVYITATTADLIAISSPVVTMTREVNTVIFRWDPVQSANSYAWQLTDADGKVVESAETGAINTSFNSLAEGSYTFSVIAKINADGYKDSESATVEFDFVRVHEEIWRTAIKYHSSLNNQTYDCTMIAYDDNAYSILAWHGVEG